MDPSSEYCKAGSSQLAVPKSRDNMVTSASEENEASLKTDGEHEVLREFVIVQLARAEAKDLAHDKLMAGSRNMRSRYSKERSEISDISGGLEHAHSLVECLPQGNRCVRPPREEFLFLAQQAARRGEEVMKTIERAFLLEEYAIQLLQMRKGVPSNNRCETVSPWALACSGIPEERLKSGERKVLKSNRLARQLNSVLQQLHDDSLSENMVGGQRKLAEPEPKSKKAWRRRKRLKTEETARLGHSEILQSSEKKDLNVAGDAMGDDETSSSDDYESIE